MTSSGLPDSYKYTAKESKRPHPLVAEWLNVHKVEALPWRHFGIERAEGLVYGYYTRIESGGHVMALTAYEDPDHVLMAYAGPQKADGSMGQRSYIEFKPGQYRAKTSTAIRDMFH